MEIENENNEENKTIPEQKSNLLQSTAIQNTT
jgi:hypothetical protein